MRRISGRRPTTEFEADAPDEPPAPNTPVAERRVVIEADDDGALVEPEQREYDGFLDDDYLPPVERVPVRSSNAPQPVTVMVPPGWEVRVVRIRDQRAARGEDDTYVSGQTGEATAAAPE